MKGIIFPSPFPLRLVLGELNTILSSSFCEIEIPRMGESNSRTWQPFMIEAASFRFFPKDSF